MKRIILCTCFSLCLGLASNGVLQAQQKNTDRSKELHIGEMMPMLNAMQALNYEKDQINLNNSRDKVIILDFFDTFCATCITTMPKLQQLQDQMKGKLQIVTVSWQDQATMEQFYRTNLFLKKNKVALPTIYADTILGKYFPHQGVPHVAWLYKGKVQAITHSDFVDKANILSLLKNGKIDLPRKNDFLEERNNTNSVVSGVKVLGEARLTGFKDAIPFGAFKYQMDSLSGMHKTSFYNMPIFSAYATVWGKIKKPAFIMKPERIVWKVSDSANYKYMGEPGRSQVWLAEHGICYERIDAVARTQIDQAKIVLDDLNQFLGLKVYWSVKKMPCLIIRKIDSKKQDISTSITAEQAIEGTGVLAFLLDYSGKYLPAIDEANSKEILSLGPYNNIIELNTQLAPYGIEVKEGIKELEVLVFEKIS